MSRISVAQNARQFSPLMLVVRPTAMTPNSTDWHASDYAKNSTGQLEWALALLNRDPLTPQERVLDIGCGDGKITAEIAKRVPAGDVVGIDSSPSMIALARSVWSSIPNVEFHMADAQQLDLPATFDVAFSNSTLHWVPDHVSVLKGVAAALRPAGRILFSMGGRGTAAVVYDALEELRRERPWGEFLAGAESPHHFYGVAEYEEWLAQTGFSAERVELVPKPMQHADQTALEGWVRTTWTPFTSRIPEARRSEFVRELAARVRSRCDLNDDGVIQLPMVNLEIRARKV